MTNMFRVRTYSQMTNCLKHFETGQASQDIEKNHQGRAWTRCHHSEQKSKDQSIQTNC